MTRRRRIKLIIEAVCSGLCKTENELKKLLSLLFFENDHSLADELNFLINRKLICCQKDDDGIKELRGTQLGRAIFASSLAPDIALQVYADLEKAMRSLALDTELHLLYLVTPLYNDSIWVNYIDWNVYYKIWCKLPVRLQRVGKLVGVSESFIIGKLQGRQATDVSSLQVHLRFLSALALFDLIREKPLSSVAHRFHINRGALQTMQQQSATYAHMIVTFCERLGWTYLRSVLDGFSERLTFGVRKDLTELVQIEGIDGMRARAFHNAKITTAAVLATTPLNDITKILRSVVPFVRRDNNEGMNRWLAGEGLMTDTEAAQQLIKRARNHISSSIKAIGIFSEDKIDSLFTTITSIYESNQSAIQKSECVKSKRTSNLSTFEVAFNDVSEDAILLNKSSLEHSKKENKIHAKNSNEIQQELRKRPPKAIVPISNEKFFTLTSRAENWQSKMILSDSNLMPSEKALKVVDKPFSAMVPPVNKNISAETKQTVDDTSFESSEIWTAMRDCVGKRVTEMTKVEKMLCTEPLQVADIAVMQSGKNEKVSLIDDQNLVVKENNDSIASQYHSDENINKLCTNLSYTSISDDTLLRLGCSLDYVYNEQTGEVVDNSEVIGSANIIPENDQNFEINGWEKIRDELEQEKEELLKCDESLAKHVITSTCSNDEVGVSEIRSSTIKTEENYTDSKAIKSPNIRCIVQQTKILESIEEEEGNTTTTFNKSKDLFDSTLSGSQLFSDKSQSSVCLQNTLEEYPCSSSESPGFRSPLHKILKPGSPLITVNNEIVLDKNINKKSTGDEKENGEFEIINVCESEALWKQFEVQRKSWNQIGLAIAVDSKDVVGVALCALFNKCFYIDLTQNFESAIGIGRRLEALYVILKSNQQKCLYDFQSFARVLRYLSLAESQNLQFNHCICIQTLSYMAHYRMDNDEYPLSFQDLVMQLSSPERAVILQSSTPRINAVVSAFVCLHMYDDLMSAAVRLSSIESVELELQSAMLFAEMESVGLLFDKHKAENMKTEIKQKLTEIETKAYHIAGIPFNFNSAAEISKILFVRLGIPPPNESTSRHYSTGKSVLKPLARHYPIANLILKWRQINIALTTSLPKLLKSCSSVGRIHPQFVIHCSTGRVLTAHPNVQNVQKNEIISGYSIRSLFIAPNGRILISSDYCQLELRILAHLSADPKLISIFSIAGDFFEIMAERWNADQAVDVNRDKVKQLCYGIIYGMGASSLSKELGISRQQAQIMIISFFQQFPKVRIWMDKMLAACRSDGFVSTMLGRRRFLPHITSVLQTEKAQAERQVINTCIQGSAAELFKIALLKLQKNLRGTNSFIIMQLHDEILVEADEDSLPSVANIVEHSMTSVITGFRVPLAVKISAGGNWGKLQKYARN